MRNLSLALLMLCTISCNETATTSTEQNNLMAAAEPQTASLLPARETSPGTVYICVSPGAKRYHLKQSCHGLKKCTHRIEQTTVKKATASGLTLCKYED